MMKSKSNLIIVALIAISFFVTVIAQADSTTAAQTTTTSAVSSASTETSKAATYNESEMPLNLQAGQVQAKDSESSAKTVLGLVFVLAVLGGTYYFVRRYANSKVPQSTLMQIKVIAQHHLGPKKSVAVIRVAGESMLVGITDNQINLIKSLSILDEDFATTAKNQLGDGADMIADEVAEVSEKASASYGSGASTVSEDFSFADLKTTVSAKIKSARGFQ